MHASKNEISTLVSILSIEFPSDYPKKESIDELDSFLPAINFPNYSQSDIISFSSIFQTKNNFKDIIESIHFYFPFVPTILEIISNYKQDTTEEILDICACIVMCSYVSWRAFVEYTTNFEHLPYILNCVPLVSQSNYISIITDVYCDSLNFYLEQCTSFNFISIFNSMELLLKNRTIAILSKMESIFFTIISKKLTSNNVDISDDCQTFISYLCQLTDTFPDIFDDKTAKEIVLLLTNQIENIEINSLHLFANFFQKIERDISIPIFSIFPVSFYKHITSTQNPFNLPEKQVNDTEMIKFSTSIQFLYEPNKITQNSDDSFNFSLIDETFSEEFPKKPIFPYIRKNSNGLLLNTETREILTYIARAAQSSEECRDIVIKDFNSFIVQKENRYHSILLYSLIFIISNLSLNNKQAKAYWNILLTSELFNNDYSAFDLNSPDNIINQMRNEAIDSMISSGFLDLHIFLTNLSKNQILLSETLHRLYSNFSQISKIEFLSTDFLSVLIQLSQFFLKLNIIEKNKNFLKKIESTRICLLQLISQGLAIDEVSIFWFSIPFFTNFLSSLIFESSVRNFVFEKYQQYLTNFFHLNDQTFLLSIKNILKKLLKSDKIMNEKTLQISIDFVSMVNSVLSEKSDTIELYNELIDIITETLLDIDYRPDESYLYFIKVLQTLSFVHLNEVHYSILKETVKKLDERKFYQQIRNGFLKLASGNHECLSDIIPLQQPKIISVILEFLASKKQNAIENGNKQTIENGNKNAIENGNKQTIENGNKNTIENGNKNAIENGNKNTIENGNNNPNGNENTNDNGSKSEKIIEIEQMINYLSSDFQLLVGKSIYNCVQVVESGIEETLIGKLKDLQLENSLKITFSNHILNLLTSIYTVHASMRSAIHFIELLSPIDSKHVSALSPYLLHSLTSLFTHYSKTPRVYLSFSSKLDVMNVDSTHFQKSFEIAFYLFIEPYQLDHSTIQLCSILDSKGKGITISVSFEKRQEIVVNHIRKHEEKIQFESNLQLGKWQLVRVKFVFDHGSNLSRHSSQSSIESCSLRSTSNASRMKNGSKSFNNSDYTPLSMLNSGQLQPPSFSPSNSQLALNSNPVFSTTKKNPLSFNFSLSPSNSTVFNHFIDLTSSIAKQTIPNFASVVSIDIDGNETEMKDLNLRRFYEQTVSVKIGSTAEIIPKGYFACFSVFPHNKNCEDNFFCWENDSYQIASSNDPLLTVNFEEKEGHLAPICVTNDVQIDHNGQLFEMPTSLADIFIRKAKVHSLILPFVEFDFVTFEQKKVPAFADFTVEMIVAVIQCGKSAQISFFENKCTEAISHLLSLCNSSNLNFSIYLQIAALLNVVLVPELKQKILSLIVLNFDIWGRAEAEVFRLITQHWHSNLFSDYKEQIVKITSIPFLLLVMRDYYEQPKIIENLIKLFLKVSEIEYTGNDFLNTIEYCTIKNDQKIINSYLEVLKRTLLSRRESDSVISQNVQFISLLHNLLELNDEDIFCSVLEIVMICHRKNFIKNKSFSLIQHIRILMGKITAGICTMKALKIVVNITNSTNPEVYPLCALIALNCGNEAIEYLAETIKPSKFLVNSFERLFWLLLLLCSIENVDKQKNFCFLFNNNFPKIKEASIMVKLISIVVDRIPDQQLNLFLNLQFTLISEHPEMYQVDFVHSILKIAYNTILFRSKTDVSEWIQKVVDNSPFNDQTEKSPSKSGMNKGNLINIVKPDLIVTKLEEICNTSRKFSFQFCPRLDENGNWQDSSLSFHCLKLFELYFKPTLLTQDLILTAFIFRVNPAMARTHLQRINISNYVSKIPSSLLSFIFYSAERKGIDLSNILSTKQSFSKSASFSFLQEFSEQNKPEIFGSEMVKMASDYVSWNEQNVKNEKIFTNLSTSNYNLLKETNLCVKNEILFNRMMIRFDILHVWQQMWNEMHRYKGRWNSAKNAAMVKNHYKRSSHLIFNDSYYPLKMTLNNEFYNDHIDASIARDIGSLKEAKLKNDDFRSKKKLYGIFFQTLRPSISNSASNYYEHISSSSFSYEKYLKSSPAFRKEAVLIKPQGCYEGVFEVFFDAFIINRKPIFFSDIREILLRNRLHRPTAFEIFKKNGKSYFIDIPKCNNSNLMKYFLPFMTHNTIHEYTEKWVNYEISTFEYLLKLNEFSSRTFNDLSAYPIMPWVISDYTSDKLDLDDPKSFRDLSKPMGAINEDRLKILKSNSVNSGESIPAHLYQNGYISPLIVLSYLVRIEPFTTMHVNYHSGRFEAITKIFKSIPLAYKNATTLKTDFMELIPEFFINPEFLLNKENFDLTGSSNINEPAANSNISIQTDSIIPDCSNSSDHIIINTDLNSDINKNVKNINDEQSNANHEKSSPKTHTKLEILNKKFPGYVNLPNWAMNSSNVFVYMNRKALESNYVSMNIHKWIDLIWGFKQRGPEAEKADNTFYPLMYSDIWSRLERKEINVDPKHVETVLSEVGQIPIQLFKTPHPQRQPPTMKGSRICHHNMVKNEETITFGVNQILLSSFSIAKIEENANLAVNSTASVSSNPSAASKFNIKAPQKSPRARDSFISGIVIDSSSRIVCLSIKNKTVTTVFNESIEKQTSFISQTKFDKLCLIGDCISGNSFACCSNDRLFFYLFRPFEKVSSKSGRVNYEISHICISEDVIATCGENLTSIWSANNLSKPLFSLPTYRDEINCVQISVIFDLLVCGTNDGFVQFYSINDRRCIQIAEIGEAVPQRIKITPSWGFVIVYAKYTTINSDSKSSNILVLFSANGMKIRQTELPPGEELTAIETYRSRDGFDFAFVATDSGNMYHFEVFFAKFEKPFYNSPFCINSISYISEQNVLYCTGKDNSILVVPYHS